MEYCQFQGMATFFAMNDASLNQDCVQIDCLVSIAFIFIPTFLCITKWHLIAIANTIAIHCLIGVLCMLTNSMICINQLLLLIQQSPYCIVRRKLSGMIVNTFRLLEGHEIATNMNGSTTLMNIVFKSWAVCSNWRRVIQWSKWIKVKYGHQIFWSIRVWWDEWVDSPEGEVVVRGSYALIMW